MIFCIILKNEAEGIIHVGYLRGFVKLLMIAVYMILASLVAALLGKTEESWSLFKRDWIGQCQLLTGNLFLIWPGSLC